VAERLEDRSDWLHLLTEDGEDMEVSIANADEVRRPDPGSWRSSQAKPDLPLPLSPADHVKNPGEDARVRARDRRHPRWHPRCHPRDERIMPKSRDFH